MDSIDHTDGKKSWVRFPIRVIGAIRGFMHLQSVSRTHVILSRQTHIAIPVPSLPISVMHRQPDGRLIRRGPFDPVPLVWRDVDEIAGLHLPHSVRELEPRCTLQN